MRINNLKLTIGFLLITFVGTFLSCATDRAPLQIENSLPQNELAYYNDAFDNFREDLWDKAGYIHRDEQMQNFKLANMRFDNGKLIIQTIIGSFSKGGLGSRYAFRGDFDVQLDCRIDFLKDTSGMDQLLNILVIDKSGKIGKSDIVVINLAMGEGMFQGSINSRGFINGRWNKVNSEKTESFDGTLRILRKGKNISTLYKKRGSSAWSKIRSFRVTEKDMKFGFQLRNFFPQRTSIRAIHSISAEFDNFRINAAHEIIEDEI